MIEKLEQYQNDKLKIYYKSQDERTIKDIEKAVIDGYNKVMEYFEALEFNKEISIYVYSNIEEFHLEVFGEKREEWGVCLVEGNIIKIVSPENSGKVHNYNTILKILSKSVVDIILSYNFDNIPKWLDMATYITGLNTETKTCSKPSIVKLNQRDYFNYSDSYFITRYIVENFGKNIVLEILKTPDKYNEILNLSDEDIDRELEKYYKIV